MQINSLEKELQSKGITLEQNVQLAPYTSWKIGGKADYFFKAENENQLIKLIGTIKKHRIPYVVIGSGTNILVSDKGFRGLVIKNAMRGIEINRNTIVKELKTGTIKPRLKQQDTEVYSDFDALDDYEDSEAPLVEVRIKSGELLTYAINYTLNKGITGLQWFAGIPGTIGGAVFNNIHGGKYFLSSFIKEVEILSPAGIINTIHNKDIAFDYDYSRFQKTGEIVLAAGFVLYKKNPAKARAIASRWAQDKAKAYPAFSAGSCFKNLSIKEQKKYNLENPGWGYIIDKLLKLKGTRIGNAKISNKHAAFIENIGNASSNDVLSLLKLVSKTAKSNLNILPKTEIFFIGFEKAETADLT